MKRRIRTCSQEMARAGLLPYDVEMYNSQKVCLLGHTTIFLLLFRSVALSGKVQQKFSAKIIFFQITFKTGLNVRSENVTNCLSEKIAFQFFCSICQHCFQEMAQTGSLLPEDGSNKLDNRRQKMEDLLLSYAFTVFNSLTIITYKLQTILQFNNYIIIIKRRWVRLITYYLLILKQKRENNSDLLFKTFQDFFSKWRRRQKTYLQKKLILFYFRLIL